MYISHVIDQHPSTTNFLSENTNMEQMWLESVKLRKSQNIRNQTIKQTKENGKRSGNRLSSYKLKGKPHIKSIM